MAKLTLSGDTTDGVGGGALAGTPNRLIQRPQKTSMFSPDTSTVSPPGSPSRNVGYTMDWAGSVLHGPTVARVKAATSPGAMFDGGPGSPKTVERVAVNLVRRPFAQ